MARPAFAGRRARSRAGQLAAFGAVVLLVAAALAVLGGAIAPVLEAGSRTIVQQSGASASAVRVQTRLADDAPEQDEAIRGAIVAALRDVPAEVVRTVTGRAGAVIAGQTMTLQLYADPDVTEAAELTSGTWPSAPSETAILDAAAARLGIAPGQAVLLDDGRELTITGTWRALDPAAARWFDDPSIGSGREAEATGPLLVDEAGLAGRDDLRVRWTVVPADAALGPAALPELADAVARLDAELRRTPGGDSAVTLAGTLDDTLARTTRVTAVTAGVLGLPLVLVGVAGAIVLGLIARAIAGGRGVEYVLLRARGASMRALAVAAARESAGVAVAGAAVGAGVAAAVLHLALPLAGVRAEPDLVLPVLISAAIALLAVVLATAVTVVELRAPVTGRAEAGRAALVAALGPLVLVLVAAGLALGQFLALGSPVVVRAGGIVRTDPLALTAPVLVLLAGALVAPVIAGPVVAVAERFARGGRGILPVLPLRQLARRARAVAAAVLTIALASGAVAVTLVFQVQAVEARLAAERAATGADLRLVLPVPTTVDSTSPVASATLVDGLEGVEGAFAVLNAVASVGAEGVPIVAGDVVRLAELPAAAPQLVAVQDELGAQRLGAELPAGTTGLTVGAELEPAGVVPDDLVIDVAVWFADRDGAARRAPLGSAPLVAGPIEVTGSIPPAATLLAIEFAPPALPDGAVVGLALDEVATSDGDRIEFARSSTELTSRSPRRLLPRPIPSEPVPVVVSAALAERLGLGPGVEFDLRLSGPPAALPLRVAAIAPRLPGSGGTAALLLDLHVLEARAVAIGGSVPAANQLWVSTERPDVTAAAVRAVLTERTRVVSPRTLSPAPLLDPTLALMAFGVAVTVLLAVLGFAAVAASIGQRRRTELAPLRSLGLSVARIRGARVIELAATAVIAMVLGALAGLLTAVLVVPGLVGVLT